jgi:hypothetical protein
LAGYARRVGRGRPPEDKDVFEIHQFTVQAWDVATGRHLGQVGKPSEAELRFPPRGQRHFTAGDKLREVGGIHGCRVRISPKGTIVAFPHYPKDSVLVASQKGNTIYLSDRVTGKELAKFDDFERAGSIRDFALSPDGRTLAAGGYVKVGTAQTKLLIWDVSDVLERARRPLPELSRAEVNALWDELGDKDLFTAHRAMRRLAASPRQALPFLAERLRPAPDLKQVAALVKQLGDEQFAVREKAERELLALTEEAAPAVRAALKGPVSDEARRRLESLLAKVEGDGQADPNIRRWLWGIDVLEQVGSPEARQLLEKLAQGSPGAWLTREAEASLRRLSRPQP